MVIDPAGGEFQRFEGQTGGIREPRGFDARGDNGAEAIIDPAEGGDMKQPSLAFSGKAQ